MVRHRALLTKLSSYGIQGHLHSCFTDFLSCCSQRVALNGVPSFPLPVQAGVPQGSVLGPVLCLVFINDLSDSLENPLYLFADDSTLCRTICHPSDRQVAASSLSADLDKITSWSNTWNMSFNPDKSHTLTMCLRKDCLENPPSIFSTMLWKKSFHSSFWVSLSTMIFPGKATFPSWPLKPLQNGMGILCRAKSFLDTPELLTTYKAFIHSLMIYCSPLWAGAPAYHLSWLHAVETKAFRIIGISCDEAESLGLSLSHHR